MGVEYLTRTLTLVGFYTIRSKQLNNTSFFWLPPLNLKPVSFTLLMLNYFSGTRCIKKPLWIKHILPAAIGTNSSLWRKCCWSCLPYKWQLTLMCASRLFAWTVTTVRLAVSGSFGTMSDYAKTIVISCKGNQKSLTDLHLTSVGVKCLSYILSASHTAPLYSISVVVTIACVILFHLDSNSISTVAMTFHYLSIPNV